MPIYVKMKDRVNEDDVVILKTSGKYELHWLDDQGENVGKWFNHIYATDLTKEQKANAVDVTSTWRFFDDYDFGGEIKPCQICRCKVLHREDGCIRCAERVYKLHIWVKPNQSHYYPNTFKTIHGDGSDFKSEKSDGAYNPLIAECDTPESLLCLIDAAQNNKLTHSVHAMTTCGVMDDTRVRGMITDHSLSDLGVYEIRWYYVTQEKGILHFINTIHPPHWY